MRKVLLIALLAAAVCYGQQPPADGTQGLDSAHLVSAAAGYVVINLRVFWTSKGGAHWRDITPPTAAHQYLGGVFFLDDHNGWAVLVGEGHAPPGMPATLAITHDGGHIWSEQPFPGKTLMPRYDMPGGTAHIFFLDQRHGWVATHAPSSSAFDFGQLFATTDGGRTWARLPDPPSGEPVRFADPKVGFQGSGMADGVVYETRDGGHSWQKMTYQLPAGSMGAEPIALPHFSGAKGLFAVVANVGKEVHARRVLVIYGTTDGGRNWRVEREVRVSPAAAVALVGTTAVWVDDKDGQITTDNLSGPEANFSDRWPLAVVASADFVDPMHGWIVLAAGGCVEFKADCWQRQKLLATSDGGASWTNIMRLPRRPHARDQRPTTSGRKKNPGARPGL